MVELQFYPDSVEELSRIKEVLEPHSDEVQLGISADVDPESVVEQLIEVKDIADGIKEVREDMKEDIDAVSENTVEKEEVKEDGRMGKERDVKKVIDYPSDRVPSGKRPRQVLAALKSDNYQTSSEISDFIEEELGDDTINVDRVSSATSKLFQDGEIDRRKRKSEKFNPYEYYIEEEDKEE